MPTRTFPIHSFVEKATIDLEIDGETLVSITRRPIGQRPVICPEGEEVTIEGTTFRVGGGWRYIGTNSPSVRSTLMEILKAYPLRVSA